jgi:hypothetical protein
MDNTQTNKGYKMKTIRILKAFDQTLYSNITIERFTKLALHNRIDRRDAKANAKAKKYNTFFIDLRNITL